MSDLTDELDLYYDREWEVGGVVCKRCGENGLDWRRVRTRNKIVWRLVDEGGELHVCNKPSADDFDDLDE